MVAGARMRATPPSSGEETLSLDWMTGADHRTERGAWSSSSSRNNNKSTTTNLRHFRSSNKKGSRYSSSDLCRIVVCSTICCCCVVPFLVSFLYVVLSLEPPSAEHGGIHEQSDFVDRGATHGGKRPVLPSDLRLGTLQCPGLSKAASQEMVYWQNIDSDRRYTSPFYSANNNNNAHDGTARRQQYLSFRPDGGGFNNIRMGLETVMSMAHAMGRTLVLPPATEVYLLYDSEQQQHPNSFAFQDFFPMEAIAANQQGLNLMSMQEFLETEGLSGHLRDRTTGQVRFPPHHNRTDWNGDTEAVEAELWPYLEQVATIMPDWNPDRCVAAFPLTRDPDDATSLQLRFQEQQQYGGFPSVSELVGRPSPVYGNAIDRLAETLNGREELCMYDPAMVHDNDNDDAPSLVHFHGKVKWGGWLLVHFYSFLFFDDWRQDLWTKRFVRDQIRYTDELQCAAARVVQAVRERARQRDNDNPEGLYHAFHVRRAEFQYVRTRVSAAAMYNISQPEIPEGSTVYMATDERDKSFFEPLKGLYDLVYLDDFSHLLEGINTNFYGMIDQLVASKSSIFFGCWFSTSHSPLLRTLLNYKHGLISFTGYINRLRGYHADRLKVPGFERGVIDSYYYTLAENKMRMREYWPVSGAVYAREFPTSWRNIDQGIEELWDEKLKQPW